jgi:hypothetical protein
MMACTKEFLHSLGIGLLVAVLLMGIGGAMVTLSWAASTGILTSASNHTGPRMAACYVDFVKEDARLQVARHDQR